MADPNNNPVAGYIEAQMTGTAGIVQAAMHGVQRVQEIMLRAMREGAGEQMALARSVTQVRDASDLSRLGEAHAGPATEQFTRYQQELISAVTEMNTEMIQASYSMMERVGQALAASSAAMGMPGGGEGAMSAYQEGVRQWQGALERMTQAATGRAGASDADEEDDPQDEAQARASRRAPPKRSGRR